MHIYTWGDEVLQKKTQKIERINGDIHQLVKEMFETMYQGNGIGLAGPQVGTLYRLFICHVNNDEKRVFINPEILQTSIEENVLEEGCLSIPGLYAELKRPAHVQVQAWDVKGRPFKMDADGLLPELFSMSLII